MKNLTPSRLIISTVFLMLFVALDAFAFDYNIAFTASGARTSIDYIVVQNLTQGTTVTVPAGSALEVTAVNHRITSYNVCYTKLLRMVWLLC